MISLDNAIVPNLGQHWPDEVHVDGKFRRKPEWYHYRSGNSLRIHFSSGNGEFTAFHLTIPYRSDKDGKIRATGYLTRYRLHVGEKQLDTFQGDFATWEEAVAAVEAQDKEWKERLLEMRKGDV